MKRKSVLRGLLTYYPLIVVASLLALAWYASHSIRQFYLTELRTDLLVRSRLIAEQFRGHLSPADSSAMISMVNELSNQVSARVVIFLPSGQRLADSKRESKTSEFDGNQRELLAARDGQAGSDVRFDSELGQEAFFVAVPIQSGAVVEGIVRTEVPMSVIDQSLSALRWRIAFAGILIVLLTLIIGITISRRIGRPIRELRAAAERFARGELGSRASASDTEEFAALGDAMNQMAEQLDERIKTITRQRNEQDAILTSMVEGVLAIDTEERVINLNRTACTLFGVAPDEARGRTIQEVVRNSELQRLIRLTLSSHQAVEGNLTLTENGEQTIQAIGSIIQDAQGDTLGALLVLHDITQLKKLESVRRDFVANVSHELKTPITSIKGFVETLQDGAIRNPADAERFLSIIARHVDRLNAIIEDLLALSRIELEAEKSEIPLEPGSIAEVVKSAVQACGSKAAEKPVRIEVAGEVTALIRKNSVLLEQAVINLLDNAIKYSEPGTVIEIRIAESGGEVSVSVSDHGCGIDKEHLPRVWERFYRVDKARSRSLGGTGLGLAIVKHIALAHGGRVSVESAVGRGSTFALHLPAVPPSASDNTSGSSHHNSINQNISGF